MTKQEFLAMSLPYGVNLMQSRKHWFTPEPDKVVLLTGLSELDNKMPGQYQNIPCEPTVFYRVDEKTTGNDYISLFKPVCRPLTDLTKPIEHKGEKFVPINRIKASQCHLFLRDDITSPLEGLQFSELRKLIEWHFDIADLISKGEAIDVNTLEINPYK